MSGTPGVVARHRTLVLVVLGAIVLLVLVSVLGRDRAEYDGPLDPRNPSPQGGQALARVLDDRGIDVSIARGQDALVAETVDNVTTVVVTDPDSLAPSTLKVLTTRAEGARALVLVGDARLLGAQLDLEFTDVPSGERRAACDNPLVKDLVVRVYGAGLVAPGCFGSARGSALVQRGDRWALSSPESLTNEHVLESDNAALGLRLLGQGDRVVWYVPDLADAAADEGFSLSAFLPSWLYPSLGLLAAAVLALALWRGRRLGPLVTEPLPVVVRAAESTHSRGRIYRRTADRGHVARILLDATRHRLAASLRLPPGAPDHLLAEAAAARTGRDPREVLALLSPPEPTTNARLVDLGRRLTELENEVRTP